MQEHHWLRHWATSTIVSNHEFEGYRGPQSGSLTHLHEPVQGLKLSYIFSGHLEPPSDQYLPWTTAYKDAERRDADMHETCFKHFNQFWFSIRPKDWTRAADAIRLTSHLPRKFSHQTLSIPRRPWSPNTESFLLSSAPKGHIAVVEHNLSHCCHVRSIFGR